MQGKSQLVSEKGLHELHIFIFMLAAFHGLYCITTLGLGRLKVKIVLEILIPPQKFSTFFLCIFDTNCRGYEITADEGMESMGG